MYFIHLHFEDRISQTRKKSLYISQGYRLKRKFEIKAKQISA